MTSYEIISAAGAVIRTFDSRQCAVMWLRAEPHGRTGVTNADLFPGWRPEEVERIERRRRLKSDRSHLGTGVAA